MSTPSPIPEARRLLVVDDDLGIRDLLRRYFAGQGFAVACAADGAGMRTELARSAIDLVLLDIGLPGEDGFELTRQLRKSWNGALIIVTGRGESVDRVVGLELGADDYVTKPFDLRELLARVRSALRRIPATAAAAQAPAGVTLTFAGFRLDTGRRQLTDTSGRTIALSSGEYELLQAFARHPQRVLSRSALMRATRGRDIGAYDRAIDVQVGRLRRKVEADPANPTLIQSVRNAGYLLACQVQTEQS